MKQRAIFELVLAGALWGFGFVATKWGLAEMLPVHFLFFRFCLAVPLNELVWANSKPTRPFWDGKLFLCALPAGFLLALFLVPQSIGLMDTTASKSSFLTSLYVVFVPCLRIFSSRPPRIFWGILSIAVLGAYFLMGSHNEPFLVGDWWTILAAFLASLHILYIEFIVPKITDDLKFNGYQSLICLLCISPWCFPLPNPFVFSLQTWFCLIGIALGSSVVAFTLQIRAQKTLPVHIASMLFLLEGPFALFFGFLLLGETLNPTQILGCSLILASAFLTSWPKLMPQEKKHPQVP